MKTSTRFLAVVVAVLMLAVAAVTVSASFPDVKENYKHAAAIETLSQLGIIGGYEDGTFRPDNNVERDEMAKLVYVLYTTFSDAGKGSVKFDDVTADNWAVGYISWCSAKSIVGGYGDGTFRPDNNVTYDEALKMVCCVLGYTDFDSDLWPTDVRQKALRELKLGENIEANGSDYLTRGQVAQLLYNALFVDMNETKVEYVYSTSYVDGNGDPVRVKVPVEVAKTLATDIWAFSEETVRVVGTETYGYNDFVKSGDAKKINVVTVYEDGSLAADAYSVALADIGLDSYADNNDALIGLNIKTVEKEGKTIAKASVLGSVKVAEVVKNGSKTNEVKIDGVVYGTDAKSDTLFANLTLLDYGDDKITVDTTFTVDGLDDVHTALVMDHDGDGVVDAIEVQPYELIEVTGVTEVAATSSAAAYTKYTVRLVGESSTFEIKSTELATAVTLKKGDMFVAATLQNKIVVDEVITPVTAAAEKITNSSITLENVGTVKYKGTGTYFANSGNTIAFDASTLLTSTSEDQVYYIYNGYVVHTTAPATAATVDSYNLAFLLYVKDATEPKLNTTTNRYETFYPAVLLIDGKEVTVNLKKTDAIDGKDATSFEVAAYKLHEDDNGYAVGAYKLVNYTVEDGLYSLKTTATDLGDTVVVAAGATFKINNNTGLYMFDNKIVDIEDSSLMFYTFTDKYEQFGTYTASTMLKKFDNITTAQPTYLLKNSDGSYKLLATVLSGKLTLTGTNVTSSRTYKNDARLIKYVAESSASNKVDGKAYYSYLFLNMETMKNGQQVVDTTLTISEGATKGEAGKFYGWDEANKKYVEVKADDTTSVKLVKITGVDAQRGIVYLDGATYDVHGETVNYGEGVKLPTDVKIFGSAQYVYTYTTFDLTSLETLYKKVVDMGVDFNAAVGTYYDDNGDLCFAWIIVDNYTGTTVSTKAYDMVGAFKK